MNPENLKPNPDTIFPISKTSADRIIEFYQKDGIKFLVFVRQGLEYENPEIFKLAEYLKPTMQMVHPLVFDAGNRFILGASLAHTLLQTEARLQREGNLKPISYADIEAEGVDLLDWEASRDSALTFVQDPENDEAFNNFANILKGKHQFSQLEIVYSEEAIQPILQLIRKLDLDKPGEEGFLMVIEMYKRLDQIEKLKKQFKLPQKPQNQTNL